MMIEGRRHPRWALVTGAARGIGLGIAQGFAEAGIHVILHDRPASPGMAQALDAVRRRGVEAQAIEADLADPDQCLRLADGAIGHAGHVDIVVLNASAEVRVDWRSADLAGIDMQLSVNLRSTLVLLQRLVPPMLERGWGRVLSLGSIQELRPNPDLMIYAACEAAQANMMRGLARRHGGEGVTFNTLSPGAIATDRNAEALADDTYRERVEAQIPAGRLGSVADCVPAAVMLCSEPAGYINGATLRVDGGWSA